MDGSEGASPQSTEPTLYPLSVLHAQYYDAHALRIGTDSLSATAAALTDLAALQSACVRLHTPTNLTDEFASCPASRPVVDPLVDGLHHSFDAGEYSPFQDFRLQIPVRDCPMLRAEPRDVRRGCAGCPVVQPAWQRGYTAARGCDEALNAYCATEAGCDLPEHSSCTGGAPLVRHSMGCTGGSFTYIGSGRPALH